MTPLWWGSPHVPVQELCLLESLDSELEICHLSNCFIRVYEKQTQKKGRTGAMGDLTSALSCVYGLSSYCAGFSVYRFYVSVLYE